MVDNHPLARNRVYGWKPSSKPAQHPIYAIPRHHYAAANLPLTFDLTPECPAVYDQMDLGSCTANALAGIHQFLLIKQGLPSFVPSRLFIYWNERKIEGTVNHDSGAVIDDGVTALMTKGVPPESLWVYDTSKFAVAPPLAPVNVWGVASHHKLSGPITIPDGNALALKSWLVSHRTPVAFGFTAFRSLQSDAVARSGVLPMPRRHEESIGGHAVAIVGYNDIDKVFICRNSWGPGWGKNGYFTMPQEYVANPELASDFRSATQAA